MRREQDHYTRKAKAAGYPARSVYKLEEIQRKFSVLAPGMRVLDIGSSPGSWSLYAAKVIGTSGGIVAVDLQTDYAPVRGPSFEFFSGDIHDEAVRSQLVSEGPYDCVLSDAAPSTTGNRTVDAARSAAIAETVIALTDELLRPGGNLVVKVFQGPDQQAILASVRERFANARQFKPPASRKESFEVFCVGTARHGHREH